MSQGRGHGSGRARGWTLVWLFVLVTAVIALTVGCTAGPPGTAVSSAQAGQTSRTSSPAGAPAASGQAGEPGQSGEPDQAAPGSVAWVRAEEGRPGSAAWRASGTRTSAKGLAAFADRVSVLPGEPVGLAIDGSGPIAVRALRIGWYGGLGARLIWSGRATARRQPPARLFNGPLPDGGGVRNTRTVIAPWSTSTVVDTTGWPEGEYLFRLDSATATQFVPLTVRSASAAGRELVVAAPMTWQAYNLWGGRSLYGDENPGMANRSYAVSFDRPYSDGNGSGRFFTFDAPIAQQIEQAGVPVAYTTDYDLALHPEILRGARAIVIGGHAEYWTGPMRDAVVASVAAGTNLAIFGANTAYWRVRLVGRNGTADARPLERRDGNPRLIFGAKDAGLDPLATTDPAGATARFRDHPAPRREDALTGLQYDCFPAEAPLTIADPTWWGYAGTGVRAGQQIEHVVGPESDRVFPLAGRPTPMQVVAYTKFPCNTGVTAQTSVYWTTSSGAGVFTAATMRWACATTGACSIFKSRGDIAIMARITRNVLAAFADGPAGPRHPALDTVSRYWLPGTHTTGTS